MVLKTVNFIGYCLLTRTLESFEGADIMQMTTGHSCRCYHKKIGKVNENKDLRESRIIIYNMK